MDPYNPLYAEYTQGKFVDVEQTKNEQNQAYGAQNWYPALEGITAASYLLELAPEDIQSFSNGECPQGFHFRRFVEYLILEGGYNFCKSSHKSAHAFKPIFDWTEFQEQMLNASVVMSFRRYGCKYLLFRQWQEMNLECRVYVYGRKIRYAEVYRDEKREFSSAMFPDMIAFVQNEVMPRLATRYESFTADVVYNANSSGWQVVEINSPCWLKCGTYNIDYAWNADRIHATEQPICRYKDLDTGEVAELIVLSSKYSSTSSSSKQSCSTQDSSPSRHFTK